MQIKIESGVLNVERIGPEPAPPVVHLPFAPDPSPARTPFFDIGEGKGAPGETVGIVVEAGCIHPMSGFHIGGGVGKLSDPDHVEDGHGSGYGKFLASGVVLGPYLQRYLKAEDAKRHNAPDEVGAHYFSTFRFNDWGQAGALPEEWWEFALGLFSLEHEATLDPIPIPSGTHLFTLEIQILPNTTPGEYELTCKDEHYYLNSRLRRRDFTYNDAHQGFTNIETFGGKITVT